ncbi:MAG: polysaccharide biosynthesis/export family protein, partial [Candidatus Binatia bacterium]
MIQYILRVLFCGILLAHAAANAVEPTAQQLQLLQQLSPEQRATALRALGKQAAGKPQTGPQPAPAVVKPRPVKGPSRIEQEAAKTAGTPKIAEKKQPKAVRQRLKQFGYDLFAGAPTTFAPATDIPVPADYVIGPGDTVQVQLFGKENAEHSLQVTREGVLNFPGIGPISVAGLSFAELKRDLRQRISQQMIGIKSSITMGPLRSIRVFVLGEAHRPGSYTVSALSTMTNALFVSGGIQSIGSLRDIQLKRSGKLVRRLDLYDLLLHGDTSGDVRLLPGDVIFIPPIGRTVGVAGEVRRPAIYEIKGEKTVAEVLDLAGGLLPTAYPQASQLVRINRRRERTLVDIDLTSRT